MDGTSSDDDLIASRLQTVTGTPVPKKSRAAKAPRPKKKPRRKKKS